ncbi:hypothetical protein F2P81_008574 [Scophthalmus maximus]|uniref:Uncharacterized protein n=1 Tax=Scophthalmus maximus TaxID=52904 RepID=A0A6A4T232_SCOMX|nr:hypothetical protein F2P81_008574 [Scophthalmus maximus]
MCEGFPTCNKDRYGYYAPASTVGQGGNSFMPKIKIPPVNEKWIFEGENSSKYSFKRTVKAGQHSSLVTFLNMTCGQKYNGQIPNGYEHNSRKDNGPGVYACSSVHPLLLDSTLITVLQAEPVTVEVPCYAFLLVNFGTLDTFVSAKGSTVCHPCRAFFLLDGATSSRSVLRSRRSVTFTTKVPSGICPPRSYGGFALVF